MIVLIHLLIDNLHKITTYFVDGSPKHGRSKWHFVLENLNSIVVMLSIPHFELLGINGKGQPKNFTLRWDIYIAFFLELIWTTLMPWVAKTIGLWDQEWYGAEENHWFWYYFIILHYIYTHKHDVYFFCNISHAAQFVRPIWSKRTIRLLDYASIFWI